MNAFSSSIHLEASSHVKAVNKIIKFYLKTELKGLKGAYVEELPNILWTNRTPVCTSTRETIFSLVFGSYAIALANVGLNIQMIVYYQ